MRPHLVTFESHRLVSVTIARTRRVYANEIPEQGTGKSLRFTHEGVLMCVQKNIPVI